MFIREEVKFYMEIKGEINFYFKRAGTVRILYFERSCWEPKHNNPSKYPFVGVHGETSPFGRLDIVLEHWNITCNECTFEQLQDIAQKIENHIGLGRLNFYVDVDIYDPNYVSGPSYLVI